MKGKISGFALCSFFIAVSMAGYSGEISRVRYLGSTIISLPSGYTRSATEYINDNGNSLALYSQKVWGKIFEFSFLKHLSGADKDKTVLNLKVNILEEGTFLPNMVWGIGDFQKARGSKIFYFAGSKSIDQFGLKLHAGFYKDPVTTNHKNFFGFEKTIIPLVGIIGEVDEGKNSIGFKVNPFPGVSVEAAARNLDSAKKHSIFKLQYFLPF